MSNNNDSDESRTVYVGNIASGTSEDHLYELFLQAGPLEYVKIPIDRVSKVAKNFAFICYRHECSVPYAVHLLNNITLQGRNLKVQARNNQELKAVSGVGIHSLDPDFLMQNSNESLLGSPPPLILNQPLTSYNPYMNPYPDNRNHDKSYGNFKSYDHSQSYHNRQPSNSVQSYRNSYNNSNNFQHNHRPMMLDTYSMNNAKDSFNDSHRRRNHDSERYQGHDSGRYQNHDSGRYQNHDSERYQNHNSSYNQNNEDRYSNSSYHGSSYRSNESRNSSNRDHRDRPYDKYNRNRSRH